MLEKNKRYEIEITDLTKDGNGVGRVDDFIVFVENVLPGDLAEVEITKLKKSYGFGKLINIINPSKDRISPKCNISKVCGGCTLQELNYSSQLALKTKMLRDDLSRIGGFKDIKILDIIGMDNPYYYRNKAQFSLMENNSVPKIGFNSPKSHDIIDIEDCCIQHPVNESIIKEIRSFIKENKITIYDEKTKKGTIRNIVTRVAEATGEIMVCIIINADSLKHSDKLVAKLEKINGMASILLNINKKSKGVIFGEDTIVLFGKEKIYDGIDDLSFEISARSFFQVNPKQTKILYKKALEFADLTGEEIVIDAYCGIGTISLFLAQKAKFVYGIEVLKEAVDDAKINSQLNNIENVEFICGDVESVIPDLCEQKNIKADVFVLDPPRKGCDERLINTILNTEPSKIVYVSCDSATLARDLKILCEEKYEIKKVQPVDMFGQTGHVETVVLMSRVK